MLIPRDGEMNYENIKELGFYFMFVASCLSEDDYNKLKKAWEDRGGVDCKPWWKFIMENTNVSVNL